MNQRPRRPEAWSVGFLLTFETFLVLFSPKSMLSDALVRTVSTQSEAVDGQRCGQTPTTPLSSATSREVHTPLRGAFLLPHCTINQGKSQVVSRFKNCAGVTKEKEDAILTSGLNFLDLR